MGAQPGPWTLLGFGVFFVALLTSFVFYELLVRRQYVVARPAWEADGRPAGFVWAGEGSSTFNSWPRSRVMLTWLFITPPWASADGPAASHLRGMRMGWYVAMAAWLVIVVPMALGRGGL